MTAVISKKDYTGRGFESLQEELSAYLQRAFPNAFNDTHEDHLLVVHMQLASFIADNLHFYLDTQYNEFLWKLVAQRDNIIAQARLLGYSPQSTSGAEVVADATCASYSGSLTISKGTLVSSAKSGIDFVTMEDVVKTGETSFTISLIHGALVRDSSVSSGTSGQTFYSSKGDVLVNTAVYPIITVSGTPWTKVDYLYGQGAINAYELEFIGSGGFRVIFGDGVDGNIPPTGAAIEFEYFYGGGSEGNVGVGRINTPIAGTLVTGGSHSVTVVNNVAASGGTDKESVESIRKRAPAYNVRAHRLVTPDDYKSFAEDQGGIDLAQVMADDVFKLVRIYVLGRDETGHYAVVPAPIKTSLLAAITPLKNVGVSVEIADPTFVTIDIEANIAYFSTFIESAVEDAVTTAVGDFIEPPDPAEAPYDWGSALRLSDLNVALNAIEDSGVAYSRVLKMTRATRVTYQYSISNGATIGTVVVSSTNQDEETWTLTYLGSGVWSVVGSVTGVYANATTGTAYSNGKISFTITAGTTTNLVGDKIVLFSSAYLGDISFNEAEYPQLGTLTLNMTSVT